MTAAKPNVLYIMADDLGYGDLGFCNGGLTHTPCLNRLARESVCLTQHYTSSPICAPARASLMTGRYPQRCGVVDTVNEWGANRLALRERTMGDVFRNAGYRTGLVGKWHAGTGHPDYLPYNRGFDEFVGFHDRCGDYFNWTLDRNGSEVKCTGQYITDYFTEQAIDFIERHRNQPWCLNLAHMAPHDPLQAPEEEIDRYRGQPGINEAVATLYGMVTRLDRGVGDVLDALDRLGLADQTIVVFTSDNGPQYHWHELGDATRYNAGLRGFKSQVYEGGVRLPALVRWPNGGVGQGQTVDYMVHMVDWLPTLCDACEIPCIEGPSLDGQSILPSLRSQQKDLVPTRCWQWNRYLPVGLRSAAIRSDNWKLVFPMINTSPPTNKNLMTFGRQAWQDYQDKIIDHRPSPPSDLLPPVAEPELYDLQVDPGETFNLASNETGRVARMTSDLEQWYESVERDRAQLPDPFAYV